MPGFHISQSDEFLKTSNVNGVKAIQKNFVLINTFLLMSRRIFSLHNLAKFLTLLNLMSLYNINFKPFFQSQIIIFVILPKLVNKLLIIGYNVAQKFR
jgi:hypothetical protein